jgi:hypothetical protein
MIGSLLMLAFTPYVAELAYRSALAEQKRPIVKPKLRRNPHGDEWVCSDDHVHAYGWGVTQEAAYELWLKRYGRALADRT